VPFSVHRNLDTATISERIEGLSVLGTYVFLDANGNQINPFEGRGPEPEPVNDAIEKEALTAAREVMARNVDGRIALGGQRSSYRGRMPGVIEETIHAIRDHKPVFIAGGYGGAAADMVVALGIDRHNWLRVEPAASPDLNELRQTAARTGWEPRANGLTDEENQRLAITYRASEVASLIVTGLSRLHRTS
jgi:hypothetical protein